ncbi:hypothetical protein AALO_G00186060 [Alosa alosa]|uniref:Uncharacterized protein n=1 Tax=Alosa alosa TaxID=278164 RepID=A0AAV6GCZ9_9TELE|nr:hypothetical protein AALO_G00186060 [Alosa alosa]
MYELWGGVIYTSGPSVEIFEKKMDAIEVQRGIVKGSAKCSSMSSTMEKKVPQTAAWFFFSKFREEGYQYEVKEKDMHSL